MTGSAVELTPTTLAVALSAIIIVCSGYAFAQFWWRPHQSPLIRLQGPPLKHWFFGWQTPSETRQGTLTQFALENTERYGNAFTAVLASRQRAVFLADQGAVNNVMLSASRVFVKGSKSLRLLRTFFGEGLLAVDGEVHKLHRKVSFPAFTSKAVEDMSPILFNTGHKLVARWERKFESQEDTSEGVAINAFDEFTLAALDVIGMAGFNYDFKSLDDQKTSLGQAFETIFGKVISQSYYSILRVNVPLVETFGRLFVQEQKELDQARRVVDSVSHRLVKEAKARVREEAVGQIKSDDVQGKDLLSLMVRANLSVDAKASERMSDRDLISMVPTFLAAGHETTSSGLSWAVYALSRTGKTKELVEGDGIEKQSRLREELLDAQNDGWQSNFQKLDRLPYLDAVTREVLRLFSPVRVTRRKAAADAVIPLDQPVRLQDGSESRQIAIAKGDDVIVQIWRMNTDPSIWGSDAMSFRPERWLKEGSKYHEGGLYPPAAKNPGWSRQATFTVGPRNCIGMHLAVAEMKTLLASVISNFEIRPVELPGQEHVEIDWRNVFVTRPFRKGRPDKLDMPCRLHRLRS